MEVTVPRGKYVIAVSGGVDSVALLDLLNDESGLELVVAHFNHGIRPDSGEDEALVRQTAAKHSLKYELGEAKLRAGASEEIARDARYAFLKRVRAKHNAQAIITAHHQDDLIETAFINILRGTGRLGLSSMSSNKKVLRPLLATPKTEILAHAKARNLIWREDSTNLDANYLRNYLRLKILPRLTIKQRQNLISNLDKVAEINKDLKSELAILSQSTGISYVNRALFSSLPADIGAELVAHHLRTRQVTDFDALTVSRLSMAIKTSKPNSKHSIKQNAALLVGVDTVSFVTP